MDQEGRGLGVYTPRPEAPLFDRVRHNLHETRERPVALAPVARNSKMVDDKPPPFLPCFCTFSSLSCV